MSVESCSDDQISGSSARPATWFALQPWSETTERPPQRRHAGPAPSLADMDLRALLQEQLEQVYRLIYSKVGDHAIAKELTCWVFRAAARRSLRHDPGQLPGFLLRIARAVVALHWSSFDLPHSARLTSLDGARDGHLASTHADHSPREALARDIQHVLHLLPPRERAAFIYRFWLHQSLRETADMLRLSEAEAQAVLQRALALAAAIVMRASLMDPHRIDPHRGDA